MNVTTRRVISGVAVAACALLSLLVVMPAGAAVSPFRESFSGGAVGTRPYAANTGYDQSTGETGESKNMRVVFDATGRSGHSARFFNTSIGNTFGFLGKQVGHQKSIYFRRYYWLDRLPANRTGILLFKYGGAGNGQLGGTHNGSFAIGGTAQSHRFTLVDNNTSGTQSQATVPAQAWFRVELRLNFSSGQRVQTARLFLGSNLNGTTPTETITGHLTGPYADYIEDGMLTNPGTRVNLRVDEAVNGSSWIGPLR